MSPTKYWFLEDAAAWSKYVPTYLGTYSSKEGEHMVPSHEGDLRKTNAAAAN